MIKPELASSDDALEFAAQLVEQMSVREIIGIYAKKKRVREDAALRGETIRETRKEMASLIRAFKDRPDLTPLTALKRIAALDADAYSHAAYLRDAWQLATKGWVRIYVTINCTDNFVPPEAQYRIEVTDAGHLALLDGEQVADVDEQCQVRSEASHP